MQGIGDAIKDTAGNFDWIGVIGAGIRGQVGSAIVKGLDAGPVADGTLPENLKPGYVPPQNDRPDPAAQEQFDEDFKKLVRNWRFEENAPIVLPNDPRLPGLPEPVYPRFEPEPPKTERERALVFGYKKPLTEYEWGGLNAFPFLHRDIEVVQNTAATVPEKLQTAIDNGYIDFASWLGLTNGNFQRGEIGAYRYPGDITNQHCLILPDNWHDLGGKQRFYHGFRTLHYIYANFFSTSSNAQISDDTWYHGVCYKSVKVTSVDIDNTYADVFEGLGAGLPINEVIEELFRNFEDYRDNNYIAFAMENSNKGEVLKNLGWDTEASLVPESLIEFSDDELLKLRFWQVKGLEEELATTNNRKTQMAIEKELQRIKATPLSRYKQINNLAERINWAVVAIHELLGDLPLKIRWKNSDIIQIGNDPGVAGEEASDTNMLQTVQWEGEDAKLVKFHNITSMLRELLVESQFIYGMNQRIMQQGTSTLTETALARQMVIKNWHLLDVIRDWIGIATKQEKKDIEFMFNPKSPGNWDDFLNPTNLPVPVEEIDLKTEEIPFSTILGYLTQAAAITHAVHTVDLSDKNKWKDYIKSKLGQYSNVADQPKKEEGEEEPDQDKQDDEWDNFLESVEQGFVGSAVLNPWGKPYSNRPRVRDISSDRIK